MLDYKTTQEFRRAGKSECLTFSEVIAFSSLTLRGIPCYLVIGNSDTGRFEIRKFIRGHHKEPIVETKRILRTKSWEEFEMWELELRNSRMKAFGE